MTQRRSATTAVFWKALLGSLLVAAPALGLTPSCSSEPEGVCSLDDNSGCVGGQTCREGKDGRTACFCSPESGQGCEGGKVCLAGPNGDPACYCSLETEAGCAGGMVCEEVPGGYQGCFPPVTIGGKVFDLESGAALAGAHVVARDANFAAVTGVALTNPQGAYTLTVPVPRTAEGALLEQVVFLRADAQGYITFPTAPRVALPIDVAKASGTPLHLETSATSVGMVRLANADGLGSVSGKVLAPVPIGTLVVAGGAAMAGGGATGIADADGSYTVFNVPAGSVTVRGYKVGLQLGQATADVKADAQTIGVDLADNGEATAVVSGKIEIVNPGMGQDTSIILVVDETFDPKVIRGEAPPGLRIAPVSGDFSLAGVPDGNYVVLAAFENDFLVRDPDTSIGGTEIVHITVAKENLAIAESFKVTGALNNPSPDNEEVVSGMPTLSWDDDSGEDHYEVRVFDAYGNLVWEKLDVPGVSGEKRVMVMYEGPPLMTGQLYQFRAVSIKQGGTPLAITEDLRGVFLYK
ncbi:MAG TPA: carboxypeptidase-like regulatory domain-containing protein [Polyangiaceae bacterium]|nr:carboxypeptidase-like regulatory domain-containing protein [Polyangiaceae bacterium]